MILCLSQFWARQGCVLALTYDLEVGAGTMCPETFLRVLGPEPWRVAYLQPSRRPADGRYGDAEGVEQKVARQVYVRALLLRLHDQGIGPAVRCGLR